MPTAEKTSAIEQAKDWYTRSEGVVFTDYRGLKVREMQALRANLRAKGGELHVIKNTLFRIAAGTDTEQMPAEFHNGPTAIAFFFENETECAKVLFDYAKIHKSLEIKGGFIAGKAYSSGEVEALSKLPPRDLLIAQLIGTIVAPLTQLVGIIEQLYADPIRVIGAVSDKAAADAPAPEPKVEAAAAPVAEPSLEPIAEQSAEVAGVTEESAVAEAPSDLPAESPEVTAEATAETSGELPSEPFEVIAEALPEAPPDAEAEAIAAPAEEAQVEPASEEAPTEEPSDKPQE